MSGLEQALAGRDDLNVYGAAKRTLFALQLTLGLEDVHAVAVESITDGPDDKSCDLVYVDSDARRVVIAQGYEATATGKPQAPASKAAGLHQAVNWLIGSQLEQDVPGRLRSAWRELHSTLAAGSIDSIEIWLVHNLPESDQNKKELDTAAKAAYDLIRVRYDASVAVNALEIGRGLLTERYEDSRTPILVTDTFELEVGGAFVEVGENWTSLCTSVPARWLHTQFTKYQERLFSANIRGYLGSARSATNINNGIRATAQESPRQFWAYNNGITALVHDFSFDEVSGTKITLSGLTIVNGAQTSGAIGSVPASAVDEARLLARFIKCDDATTVQEIIRFNNRQNPTQAADFRSNDRVQARLVTEFNNLGVVGYTGGRRGGAEDVSRRPGENQLSAMVAAQALAAFHGKPDVAYHEKGKIWEQDLLYSQVFPDRTTARHILFVYTLLKTVEKLKTSLSSAADGERTEDNAELADWFSLRGSLFLAVAAVGATCETLVGVAVPDRYTLQFKRDVTMRQGVEIWEPIVAALLALAPTQLTEPLAGTGGLRNRAAIEAALKAYRGLIGVTRQVNAPMYGTFATAVKIGHG